MKYGVDLTSIEARNQQTRILCGESGELYAKPTSLLENPGPDR